MKVCVFGLRGFPQVEGGVEKHCESLYSHIQYDADITVLRRKPYVRSKEKYKNITFIDLVSTKIKGLEVILHSFIATRKAAKLNPDVVHIHNIGPALFAKHLYKKGIPVVLTYHSPNYEHDKWGRIAKKILLHCEKVALKYSSRIIFVNKYQMEKYPMSVQQKSVFIPNGRKKAVITANTNYLRKIGATPGNYVLAVGRITPEKGFDTLIKGFELTKKSGCKLVIAGGVEFENNYMEELKAIASDDVIFTGYVEGDELAQLYTNAALYVLSSRNEGFPLVLLEAMSYGIDILASDIPAAHLVELKKEDYFPYDDYRELSQKIKQRMTNPVKRTYRLEKYDWNQVGEKTVKIYESLSHKSRGVN